SMDSAADELEMLASRLHEGVRNLLQQEQRRLSGYKNRIPSAAYHRISDAKMALLTVRKDVVQAVTSSLFRHRHRLELLQQRLADASPEKLLARGYSITLKDGKVVKNADELQENDMITTRLQNGEVVSIVHI
ncbi:exodeoxyribonuclease VII large subunit, partial [Bacteroides uniformis]